MQQKNYRVKRRRKKSNAGTWLILLIALAIIVCLAYAIARLWQKQEQGPSASRSETSSSLSSEPSSSSSVSSSASSSSVSESSSSESESSSEPAPSSSESSEPVTPPVSSEPVSQQTQTEPTTPIDASFFDDALFIGDSLTYGIQVYGVLNNADVLATTSVNLSNISTREAIKINGQYVPLTDALPYFNPGKVFIMLGSNGIEFINTDTHISLYSDFVDIVKNAYPNATIYLQSVLPVTQQFEASRPQLTNAIIRAFNSRVEALAAEKGCGYINVNAALCDASGALPYEASPLDGMHFGATYYEKWFRCLQDNLM